MVRLQESLGALVEKHGVPGAAVAVLADGEVVDAAAGVVNVRTGVEARPDSPFMIQSITKVWTATLVMQLVDEGLVALDDPVRRHLPGFRTADEEQSAAITIRHLLTHTGGFEGDLWTVTTCGDDALRRLVDDHVSGAPQHAPPGEMYSYCSAGMAVLGRLVEVMRGTTYASALRSRLAMPLGVDGLAFDAGEAVGFTTAIGHVRARPGEALRPVATWAVMPASNPAAGNQLAMPARGLVELARLHLADGRAPSGERLLSAESARLMRDAHVHVPATRGKSVAQGLGWRVSTATGVVDHGGGTIGSSAMLRLVPDRGVAVAVVANTDEAGGLIEELCRDLLGELADLVPPAAAAVPDPAPVDDVSRFTGRYELRNVTWEVDVDESGRLRATRAERGEAVEMAVRAGLPPQAATEPTIAELRRLDGEVFVQVDDAGRPGGLVEFIGSDDAGRARYLHAGRAAPRTSQA